MDTFDLTLLRTDPTVVGVEVFWEYAIITGELSQRSVPGNLLSLEVSDTVTFTAEESDPDAERVENDPAAVAQAQRVRDEEAAELAGCEAHVYEVEGSKFTFSSADGSTSVVVDLPPDWTVELETYSDPCIPPYVSMESPPAGSYYDELGVSLFFSRPLESTLVAEAEPLRRARRPFYRRGPVEDPEEDGLNPVEAPTNDEGPGR